MDYIKSQILRSIEATQTILEDVVFLDKIKKIAEMIVECYKNNGKVLFAGNGGSASDCEHLACELVSKMNLDRQALNAISLTTNTSILTAISNDFGFENVFSRQIEALGVSGDIFIAISTSGNSKNIIKTLEQAKKQGLVTVGFTGESICLMDNLCDVLLKVPSNCTPTIQEVHILLGHIICGIVEENLRK